MPQRRGRVEVAAETQSAAVVAKRLCDLLLTFPASAAGGVQWQVLAKKYEERHAARLDVTVWGHSTALGAASALLWDVLRLVDSEDVDNPVVAVEDGVALLPQPGLLGCWPSLYQAVSNIVLEHGAPGTSSSSMLLSQLRPLLERNWHANFDETGMGFRSQEGTFIRLKKMKHLLTAVIRWREDRQSWRKSTGSSPADVDQALLHKLELLPSIRHNDLVLVCSCSSNSTPSLSALTVATWSPPLNNDTKDSASSICRSRHSRVSSSSASSSTGSMDLQMEVERLRAENQELRVQNLQMQGTTSIEPLVAPEPQLPGDLLDDPFEPPPQKSFWLPQGCFSDCGSTGADSEKAYTATPMSDAGRSVSFSFSSQCTSSCASGLTTPRQNEFYQNMTPVWFPMMPMPARSFDVSIIPSGIVQSARQQFERIAGM